MKKHFRAALDLKPKHILELGMFDGGSLAFWNEILHPEKIVGVDLEARADSVYFRDYVRTRGLEKKVRTYWGTNQADYQALLRIVKAGVQRCVRRGDRRCLAFLCTDTCKLSNSVSPIAAGWPVHH